MVEEGKGETGWKNPVGWGQISVRMFAWSVLGELLQLWLPLLTGPLG